MRNRLYPRLAATGIAKNGRLYVPYLLTCCGMIMMYYIMQFLIASEHVAALKGGSTLQDMLSIGSGVFTLFALIFLFYTNSFLIRSRKREFGLYNILGMGKRNLAGVLICEAVMMALISLAGGLLGGILFSKLAELCIARLLDDQVSLQFEIQAGPVVRTTVFFLIIFGLILLNALFQVGKTKPVDMLHSAAVGEKPPRANWFLAVLGAVILAAAYYLAVTIEDPLGAFATFFGAVAMVIVATYLLFIAGSVVLCKSLQKRKNYYYKANHFVSVSSMMYRMKRNGAGLASICILSTIVLVMLSAVTCLYVGNEGRLKDRYPRNIELYTYTADESYTDPIREICDASLEQYGLDRENVVDYRYLEISGYVEDGQVTLDSAMLDSLWVTDYKNIRDIYFVPLADYNRIAGTEETLAENEAILYCPKGSYDFDTITLERCSTLNIKKQAEKSKNIENINGNVRATVLNSIFLFVPETVIEEVNRAQQDIYGENASGRIWYYGFDVDADEEMQKSVAADISQRIDQLAQQYESFPSVLRSCRAEERADFYALYNGLFALGILLGVVFLAATVLIMYYKQVTEGLEDQTKFEIMQKVGMTRREIRSSINSQMLTVFLLPLLAAGVHTSFAFPIVSRLLMIFGVINTRLLVFTTIGCFLVFALFYLLVYMTTSRAYYRIVSSREE